MAILTKKLLALAVLGSASLTAGCATGGYYDDYGYYGDRYAYGAPTYYYDNYPGYVAPSVGLGFGYSYYDGGDRQRFRERNREWRDRQPEFRGRDGQWTAPPEVTRDAYTANRDQDAMNRGADGRGWSHNGERAGGSGG